MWQNQPNLIRLLPSHNQKDKQTALLHLTKPGGCSRRTSPLCVLCQKFTLTQDIVNFYPHKELSFK
jgi:hypothetical protein